VEEVEEVEEVKEVQVLKSRSYQVTKAGSADSA
jgi:hypothetical protein